MWVFKCKVLPGAKLLDILKALQDQHHYKTKGLSLRAKAGGKVSC